MAQHTRAPRLALGQMNPTVGDFPQNISTIIDLARRAQANRADVLALPYGALTGHPLGDLPHQTSFARAVKAAVKALAQRLQSEELADLPVIFAHDGLTGNSKTDPLNEQIFLIHDGAATEILPKDQVTNVECAGFKFGILTQTQLARPLTAKSDIDALLVLGAVPFESSGPRQTMAGLEEAAQIAGAPLGFVNLVGGQDELVFPGGSAVFNPRGEVLSRAPLFAEHLVLASSAEVGDVSPEESEISQTYRALTLALADYVAKNGFRSVVLGMSGGIDSALVAAIAADAIGGARVYGIGMPSPNSSQHSRDDAADLARRIGAHFQEIPIGDTMDAFTAQMEMPGVAGENLQARIRGVYLMAASNAEGHLVLAPGNKSELAVGYSTIYGDAVGGFGPIKDLYKTDVWALARWRNNKAVDGGAVPPIPESSITKPPSAELRPGQLDQDSLPDYSVLDPLLRAHIEEHAGRADLIAAGFAPATVDWALRAVRIAEWKRRQYPVGPKVTARSFDANRKVPITSHWRDSEEDDV